MNSTVTDEIKMLRKLKLPLGNFKNINFDINMYEIN